MTEYRIKGEYGPGDIQVYTEWFDFRESKVHGIKLGLEIRGWENTQIEQRERSEDSQ